MLNLYQSSICPVRLARASHAGDATRTYLAQTVPALRSALRVAGTMLLQDAASFGPVSALCNGENAETIHYATERARDAGTYVPIDAAVETYNGTTLYMTPRGDFQTLVRIHAEHGPSGRVEAIYVHVHGPIDELPFAVWFDASAMDDCDGIERGRALAATIAFALFDAP